MKTTNVGGEDRCELRRGKRGRYETEMLGIMTE